MFVIQILKGRNDKKRRKSNKWVPTEMPKSKFLQTGKKSGKSEKKEKEKRRVSTTA